MFCNNLLAIFLITCCYPESNMYPECGIKIRAVCRHVKMIKPIVNISKVIEPYNTVIVGFNGVLSEGNGVKSEAVEALIQMKRAGRHIVLLSNTALRVSSLINCLHENKLPVAVFDAVVTAGEILHYKFKARQGEFAAIGSNYYKIGDARDKGVFAGLDYQPAEDISVRILFIWTPPPNKAT